MALEQLFTFTNLHLFLLTGTTFFVCGIAQFFTTRAENLRWKKYQEGFEAGLKAVVPAPPVPKVD